MRSLLFLLLCASSLSLPAALKRCTCSFHLSRCSLPLKQQPQIFSKLPQEDIRKILSQTFRYLDRGAQAFVFTSEDGLYVLKLFFFDSSMRLISRYLGKMDWSFRGKAQRMMEGCRAASLVSEETALIYLHFGSSKEVFPEVRLVGPAWKRSLIHCSHYCFALQKRAESFQESLQSAYALGDRKAFFKRIHAFYSLLQKRIGMDIYNSDSNLFRNFGFVGHHRAIEIDFGNYQIHREWDEKKKEKEFARYKNKLVQWVEETMPEWKDEMPR